MELKMYPVLSKEFSLSKVITEKGENMVIYNTATMIKARPNAPTFEFVKRCRGDKTLEEIISELSSMSGEPPEKIQENLRKAVEIMVDNQLITFSPSPVHPLRPEPCEIHLYRRLTSIVLEITRHCNLQCKHCYSDSGKKRDGELTIAEIKKMIDELADMGVLNIVITGGEPLLHPHLFEVIKYVREKPMSVMLFTNGFLLTKEIVQKLREFDILSVSVSIDGACAETHDSFRGIPGSFERVVQAIKLLKEADLFVWASISVHKGTLGEVKEIMDLLKKWGVDDYRITPVSYTGRPEELNCGVTPEEYKEFLRQLKEYEKSAGNPGKELPYSEDLTNCGIGMSSLTVRSDGTVAPCPPFPEEISLGDIRKDSISDIWNNSGFLKKARSVKASENEKCRECPHINVCQGGCLADCYMRTGELRCGDPYECAYFSVYNDYTPVEVARKTSLHVEIR